MAKMKWKSNDDMKAKKLELKRKELEIKKFKGKEFKNLSSSEKDDLLEILARSAGLI